MKWLKLWCRSTLVLAVLIAGCPAAAAFEAPLAPKGAFTAAGGVWQQPG
jgi:hypothetical protein